MPASTPKEVPYRPWLNNYPPGMDWQAELELTPVHEQVLAMCESHPDLIALDFLGASTTYGELGDIIEVLSAAVQNELGVKKGTRVAMLLPNSPYFVYFYYAVLRAGGIIVNCNPLYTVRELDHIVSNSGAEILITLDLKELFNKAEALVEITDLQKIVVCTFTKALSTTKSILFRLARHGEVADVKASPIADMVVPFSQLMRTQAQFAPVPIDFATDIAVQQYTGGTTGIPRGALLSHANIAANLAQIDIWSVDYFRPGRRLIAVLPFFHIFSMTACLNASLVNGMELLMLPRFELKMLLDLIARKRPHYLMAVPTLVHALCASRQSKKYDLSCLELCISGGAALPSEVRTLFTDTTGGRIVEGYGLTECAPVVTCGPINAPDKPGSIGQPLPQTDVRFAGLDDPAVQVEPGERGELQVRGPQVMMGYYKDEGANEEAFVEGWLRTGDVGYVDNQGHMYIVDRIKDLIVCSGFNIYPRMIEDAMVRHPAIEECTVIGVEDTYRGEAPVAYVKLLDGTTATVDELKTFLSGEISKIEMPREIIFKDELPKTLIGKLSKKELREEYKQRQSEMAEAE